MTALALLVDVLACYRLTRLVTADTITGALRWRIIRWAYRRADYSDDVIGCLGPQLDEMVDADLHDGQCLPGHGDADSPPLPPKLAQLVRCRWCAGVWIAAAVAAARWVVPDVWTPVAYALAVAAVAVLLAGLEEP